MSQPLDRRRFLENSAAATVAFTAWSSAKALRAAESPGEKIVVGVMGINGRGRALADGFASVGGCEVAYLCDVDEKALDRAKATFSTQQTRRPDVVKDFRRILDDKSVDALVIAAPDHWHAPATILGCAAGKHVYVEKPLSHNPREGELAVAAARKYNKVVQMGSQRRSVPGVVEAIKRVHAGEIGKVLFARGWYNNARPTIGIGKPAPVPATLDYNLWQGPAPEREYHDNYVHYNWHWFWHWGTGELGNNGIHSLDICRWGLNVDYPRRVVSGGGKYRFEDDQETPDTHTVTYDFGDKAITWEGRSWHRHGFEGSAFGIMFYGDQGSVFIDGGVYKVLDPKDKLIAEGKSSFSHDPHLLNFLDCIRTGNRPAADVEEAHKSTMLCHLGNIAYRTGHTVNLDPQTHQIVDDPAAAALWGREYRQGWEPKV